MRLAVAAAALLVGSCTARDKLEQYCARTGSCTCTVGQCCINAGASCAEGQPCCSGSCSGGACPSGAAGGSAAGGSTAGGGSAGGGVAAGGGAGGGSAGGAAAVDCGAPCDGGCSVGRCCRSDSQCSTGQCLTDVCAFAGERVTDGGVCDDATDCPLGQRCDLSAARPTCVAEVAMCGPVFSACSESTCCVADGGCQGGLCRAACSRGGPTPCARPSDCCTQTDQACGDTNTCVTRSEGRYEPGYHCEHPDQCFDKACDGGRCIATASTLGVACGSSANCTWGQVCDGGCCYADGERCVFDSSCCSGQCFRGWCSPLPRSLTCGGVGEPCIDDNDCCLPHAGCLLFTRTCSETLIDAEGKICVIEFPGCRYLDGPRCTVPGQPADTRPCCFDRSPDGGKRTCVDAGTCVCNGSSCAPVDAGYICPL